MLIRGIDSIEYNEYVVEFQYQIDDGKDIISVDNEAHVSLTGIKTKNQYKFRDVYEFYKEINEYKIDPKEYVELLSKKEPEKLLLNILNVDKQYLMKLIETKLKNKIINLIENKMKKYTI